MLFNVLLLIFFVVLGLAIFHAQNLAKVNLICNTISDFYLVQKKLKTYDSIGICNNLRFYYLIWYGDVGFCFIILVR